MRIILLTDNGSKRATSTLSLRALAKALAARIEQPVSAVSLLHADQVAPELLDGQPAQVFKPFMRERLQAGVRDFAMLPLFFGLSRALTEFTPAMIDELREEFGPFQFKLAPSLCPLPAGEPRLAQILVDHVRQTATQFGIEPRRVVLVDHGSPLPQVTAVRNWLAGRLAQRLGSTALVEEAVMERRSGSAYDFNGVLLEQLLHQLAERDPSTPVILAMLFLAPGRHAGPNGDITGICERVGAAYPGVAIHLSPLIAQHPLLIEILESRLSNITEVKYAFTPPISNPFP